MDCWWLTTDNLKHPATNIPCIHLSSISGLLGRCFEKGLLRLLHQSRTKMMLKRHFMLGYNWLEYLFTTLWSNALVVQGCPSTAVQVAGRHLPGARMCFFVFQAHTHTHEAHRALVRIWLEECFCSGIVQSFKSAWICVNQWTQMHCTQHWASISLA